MIKYKLHAEYLHILQQQEQHTSGSSMSVMMVINDIIIIIIIDYIQTTLMKTTNDLVNQPKNYTTTCS